MLRKESGMWKGTRMLGIALLVMSLSGCADSTSKEELKVEKAGMISTSATVTAIDMKTRMVTLKGPDGGSLTIHAGKEVVNLPQVKVGDEVVVSYAQALAVRMAKPGEVRDDLTQGIGKAVPGSMPGAVEVTERTVTAKILELNKARETATLQLPDGDVRIVKVQDTSNFERVKVGDTIVITFTEAMAISVERAKK
jgi:ribosomal 50S subunit-recycling heat shock protein